MMIPEIAFTLDRNNRCLACEDKDERIAILERALELTCIMLENHYDARCDIGITDYYGDRSEYFIKQAEAERGAE